MVVNTGGVGVRLYATPDPYLSNAIAVLRDDTRVAATGTTAIGGGYTWYSVTSDAGIGWIPVGNWLEATDGAGLRTGALAMVRDTAEWGLPVMAEIDAAGEVLAVLANSTVVSVIRGPYFADGFMWWLVGGDFGTGFVATAPWLTETVAPTRSGDFDGDGRTDVAVWRPATGEWWILKSSGSGYMLRTWGLGVAPFNDVAVPADYDGDGRTDVAVWRPATGEWWILKSSDASVLTLSWGLGVPPVLRCSG